ncbi:MAG: sensor histidine kinase [Bacteroidota bacterium]
MTESPLMQQFFTQLFTKANRWQLWFWLIVFMEALLGSVLGNGQTLAVAAIFRGVGLITKVIAAYLLAYYLIPKVLFKRRYISFIGLFILSGLLLTIVARFLNIHVAEALLFPEVPRESLGTILNQMSFTVNLYFGRVFNFAFWFAFIKIGIDHLRSQQQLTQLSREKAEAELNFLKAQIHPHFLFNTLNNLYTLCLEKSDEAPEVVEKLSDMLDYVLYQCSVPKVPIQKEIDLLNNYLGLEAMRYGHRLELSFEHEVDQAECLLAPLILLSPVENAFKHGASGATVSPKIKIDLLVAEGMLNFSVWNTKPSVAPTDERAYTAGIGLKNVRSQLALTYPNRHKLSIREDETTYQVDIFISL